MDRRLVSEEKDHLGDRAHQDIVIAAGQIGPSDRACEERVSHEQVRARLAFPPYLQTHAPGAMPGRVVDADLVVTETKRRRVVEDVDRRLRLNRDAEHRALLDDMLVERQVVPVQVDRRAKGLFRCGDAGDVIDVRVRQQDGRDVHVETTDDREHVVDFVAWVDDDCLPRALAAHHEAILVERRHRPDFENHSTTIVSTPASRFRPPDRMGVGPGEPGVGSWELDTRP